MTRINLVDPSILTDQHLLAEYRELPRVFRQAISAYNSGRKLSIPLKYVLGPGHVKFFYDKLKFLKLRQEQIIKECKSRGFKIIFNTVDFDIPIALYNDYIPTKEAVDLSKSRLAEKILEKPMFYKFYGKHLCQEKL